MNGLVWLQSWIIIICMCTQLSYEFQAGTPEYWNYLRNYAKHLKDHERTAREYQNRQTYDLTLPETIIAEEEKEHLVSQFESTYASSYKAYGELKNAKPIVDTASDAEKCVTQRPASTENALTSAYERFSNILNSAIEIPAKTYVEAVNQFLKYLDFLGSKFIHLNHKLDLN